MLVVSSAAPATGATIMKYRIEGAHAETGEPVTLELDAPDRNAAEERAREMGVLISRIAPAGGLAPPARAVAEPDADSLAVLIAELRALRRDVMDGTEATLRFTRAPISKIAWGYFFGMLLLWGVSMLVGGLIFGAMILFGAAVGSAY